MTGWLCPRSVDLVKLEKRSSFEPGNASVELYGFMFLSLRCVFVSMWLSRSGDDPGDQMNELKQKLKSELRVLLVEQHDQIKKKKEQHNTEVQTQTL